ncbi:ARID domain-containing protein C08B11.3 [Gossypium australe]|uniref:ARID domain-containing protein C08B11.3 n=1 Tax=Gossypium australe TaxID=47621 RepID=A0A5B6UYN6_9ROSI|nr:ARID domain-containing protein C08B11.3 [Gossypium australe]
MTQKGNLFKGQKKQKTIPPNRHGKVPHIRKGKRVVKPSKMTKEMDADRVKIQLSLFPCSFSLNLLLVSVELTKFINHCNEIKAATVANKDGGQLSIVKPPPESSGNVKE